MCARACTHARIKVRCVMDEREPGVAGPRCLSSINRSRPEITMVMVDEDDGDIIILPFIFI